MAIGSESIGESPQREGKRQRLYSAEESSLRSPMEIAVKTRRENCTGPCVKCVNPDLLNDESAKVHDKSRGTCIECGKHTPWWCAGCHESVCHDSHQGNEKYCVMDLGDGKQKVFKRSCFLESHLEALEQKAAASATATVTPHATRH